MSIKHWQIIGVLVAIETLLYTLPSQTPNYVFAAALVLSGLGVFGVAITKKAGPTPADTTITSSGLPSVPTLLGPENPQHLIDLGFTLHQLPALHRWEREVPPSAEQLFEETEVIIAKGGNRIALASVFDVHKDCAWRVKSPDSFVYDDPAATPCDLAGVLGMPKYQERLSAAGDVVYIGMESFPDSPVKTECHGTLSYCRAMSLADISYKVRPDDWKNRKHWSLDLGTAKTNDRRREFDQRRAIVIGLRERITDAAPADVVRDIVMTTKISDVDLADYSGSATAQAKLLKLGDRQGHVDVAK